MHIEYLKVAGVVLSLVGTIILAVRVTKMLGILTMAAKMWDVNMQIEAARTSGNSDVPNIRMYGVTAHIEGVERLGTKLLAAGFCLQIIGGACTAISFLLSGAPRKTFLSVVQRNKCRTIARIHQLANAAA